MEQVLGLGGVFEVRVQESRVGRVKMFKIQRFRVWSLQFAGSKGVSTTFWLPPSQDDSYIFPQNLRYPEQWVMVLGKTSKS